MSLDCLGQAAVMLDRLCSALQQTCSRGVIGGIAILFALLCVGMNIQRQPATFEVIPEICDSVSDRESDFVEVLGTEYLLHSRTFTLAPCARAHGRRYMVWRESFHCAHAGGAELL